MMAVPIETDNGFSSGTPVELFRVPSSDVAPTSTAGRSGRNYDVAEDGQKFLMIAADTTQQDTNDLVLVQNWFEELKRLVPTD